MTPAQDPKQLWHPFYEIMAVGSWLWNPGCVDSWLQAVGGIWEASGSQEGPGEARARFGLEIIKNHCKN